MKKEAAEAGVLADEVRARYEAPAPAARNDVVANIAIVAAGLITAYLRRSARPDLIVGLGIMLMNADAAREVYAAARAEHRTASP